jgi:hypothetical protein
MELATQDSIKSVKEILEETQTLEILTQIFSTADSAGDLIRYLKVSTDR